MQSPVDSSKKQSVLGQDTVLKVSTQHSWHLHWCLIFCISEQPLFNNTQKQTLCISYVHHIWPTVSSATTLVSTVTVFLHNKSSSSGKRVEPPEWMTCICERMRCIHSNDLWFTESSGSWGSWQNIPKTSLEENTGFRIKITNKSFNLNMHKRRCTLAGGKTKTVPQFACCCFYWFEAEIWNYTVTIPKTPHYK